MAAIRDVVLLFTLVFGYLTVRPAHHLRDGSARLDHNPSSMRLYTCTFMWSCSI